MWREAHVILSLLRHTVKRFCWYPLYFTFGSYVWLSWKKTGTYGHLTWGRRDRRSLGTWQSHIGFFAKKKPLYFRKWHPGPCVSLFCEKTPGVFVITLRSSTSFCKQKVPYGFESVPLCFWKKKNYVVFEIISRSRYIFAMQKYLAISEITLKSLNPCSALIILINLDGPWPSSLYSYLAFFF